MSKLTIGVLGGMGPQATCDLFQKIIDATPAKRDQDHVHVIIDNNPQVPDRTSFFLGKGVDPTDELIAMAKRLEAAGCDFLIIPCNTAHFFAKAVEAAVGIPFLSMIDNVAEVAAKLVPPGSAVGIMATDGTLQNRLYHDALEKVGLVPMVPDAEAQAQVMEIIYGPEGVKAGVLDQKLRLSAQQVANGLIARGAAAIIAGCTEIPLVLADGDVSVPVLDSTGLLAKAAVERALASS
ncbi:MAG: aspartate/glutamate racemase family protein [Bacillota bacterium]